MTYTPSAGNYLVSFSASGNISSSSGTGDFAIFFGSGIMNNSERFFKPNNTTAQLPMYTQAKVTADGVNAITVQYKTSAGTFTVYQRNLEIEQVT
jgi:hypothetical protein